VTRLQGHGFDTEESLELDLSGLGISIIGVEQAYPSLSRGKGLGSGFSNCERRREIAEGDGSNGVASED
jgi:hypothetical protein